MKQRLPRREEVDLPHIRIEVAELLKILERVSDGKYKIIGQTSDCLFENIEEMKARLAQFAQNPTIAIGPVVLYTFGNWNSPSLMIELDELRRNEGSDTIDEARMLMEALERELIPYKSWLASWSGRMILIATTATGGTLAGLALHEYLSGFDWVQLTLLTPRLNGMIFLLVEVLALVSIGLFGLIVFLINTVGENTVFHHPRPRSSRDLLVGICSTVTGALIGAVATYFLK